MGPHAYFGGLFSIDESLDDAKYAIFDDIQGGLEYFPSYKNWLGGQKQFYVTDKYRGKTLINWGRPSIWLANNDPRYDKGADTDWIEGNCVFIYIDESLLA